MHCGEIQQTLPGNLFREMEDEHVQTSSRPMISLKSVEAGESEGLNGYKRTDITYPTTFAYNEITCWRRHQESKAK